MVIAFYMAFMLALGPLYRKFSSTASDFFRGGGGMLWWLVGSSGFMVTFTAWSFTGGAAKAYETGTFFMLLFLCNCAALVFTYFFTAARYRRMRIITIVEAVRKRFGPANEQVFTWLPVPFFVVFGGISLYTIGIFMGVVFNASLPVVIIVLGAIVTGMAIFGGSWAVVASDFLQMLVVLSITVFMTFLVLAHADIGGLSGLLDQMPAYVFDWTEFDRPWIIVFFALTLLFNQVIQMNSIMQGAAKYVYCKNGPDAKRATVLQIVGFTLLSPVWMIPALAAIVFFPDLASLYPELNNPNEAAYVATAILLLPPGLMGLLVGGMFAATMSSMDTGLNRSAGIIVRNFYLPLINPEVSEARQILLGRIITAVFGCLMIFMGLFFNTLQSLPLFDLILLTSAAIGIPMATPMFLGIFDRKAPSWAAWSTTAVGLAVSIVLFPILQGEGAGARLQAFFGADPPLRPQEVADLRLAITTLVMLVVTIGWYFGCRLFSHLRPQAEVDRVDAFFEEMATPIDMAAEHAHSFETDQRQYKTISGACLLYGGFISLLALLPNTGLGRIGFLFCGGLVLLVGLALLWAGRAQKRPPWDPAAKGADAEGRP